MKKKLILFFIIIAITLIRYIDLSGNSEDFQKGKERVGEIVVIMKK